MFSFRTGAASAISSMASRSIVLSFAREGAPDPCLLDHLDHVLVTRVAAQPALDAITSLSDAIA